MPEDLQKKIFAKNLNYFLKKSGKMQNDIAKAINVAPSSVTAWCNGVTLPRMGKIQALADFFGIQKSDLIEEKKPEEFLQPVVKKKKVPILGVIAAGVPLYADQQIEGYIDTDRACIDYALRIKGDSMINTHILHGGLTQKRAAALIGVPLRTPPPYMLKIALEVLKKKKKNQA